VQDGLEKPPVARPVVPQFLDGPAEVPVDDCGAAVIKGMGYGCLGRDEFQAVLPEGEVPEERRVHSHGKDRCTYIVDETGQCQRRRAQGTTRCIPGLVDDH